MRRLPTLLVVGLLAAATTTATTAGTATATPDTTAPYAARAARSDPWSPDPATTARLGSDDAVATAIAVSRTRFADDAAGHVVLTRDDKFPDALAGTPLVGDGPMLLTNKDVLDAGARTELDRVLGDGGRVYVLGGVNAMSQAIEDELAGAGYEVRRLAGASRYDTAIQIAEEVTQLYPEGSTEILIARGYGTDTNPTAGFADSVTGGGYAAHAKSAVVLSDSATLTPQTAAYINGRERAVLLGGQAALSSAVEESVKARTGATVRVSGAGRDATAVAIATDLWGRTLGQGRFTVINGYAEDAWQFGLPAAGLAADFSAPLLVVANDVVPAATEAAVSANDAKSVATLVVGGTGHVAQAVINAIEARDGCDGCTDNPPAPRIGDGTLRIGRLLPWTGPAPHIAASIEAATDLAAGEIEGMPPFGLRVEFLEGDTESNGDSASAEIARLADEGAEAIVGPLFSSVLLASQDAITAGGVPACSPTSTIAGANDNDPNGLIFRTAPSDHLQARALVKHAAQTGHSSVALLWDPGAPPSFTADVEEVAGQYGVTLTATVQDDGDGSWDEEVSTAVASGATGYLVVAWGDAARPIVDALADAGIADGDIIGHEGLDTNGVDPGAEHDGLTGITQRGDGFDDFSPRFRAFAGPETPEVFAAHAYDCIALIVLAAVAANSDDPAAIASEMVGVSGSGEPCDSISACLALLADGVDIDYEGASGGIGFDANGEITMSSYATWTYVSGTAVHDGVIQVP